MVNIYSRINNTNIRKLTSKRHLSVDAFLETHDIVAPAKRYKHQLSNDLKNTCIDLRPIEADIHEGIIYYDLKVNQRDHSGDIRHYLNTVYKIPAQRLKIETVNELKQPFANNRIKNDTTFNEQPINIEQEFNTVPIPTLYINLQLEFGTSLKIKEKKIFVQGEFAKFLPLHNLYTDVKYQSLVVANNKLSQQVCMGNAYNYLLKPLPDFYSLNNIREIAYKTLTTDSNLDLKHFERKFSISTYKQLIQTHEYFTPLTHRITVGGSDINYRKEEYYDFISMRLLLTLLTINIKNDHLDEFYQTHWETLRKTEFIRDLNQLLTLVKTIRPDLNIKSLDQLFKLSGIAEQQSQFYIIN